MYRQQKWMLTTWKQSHQPTSFTAKLEISVFIEKCYCFSWQMILRDRDAIWVKNLISNLYIYIKWFICVFRLNRQNLNLRNRLQKIYIEKLLLREQSLDLIFFFFTNNVKYGNAVCDSTEAQYFHKRKLSLRDFQNGTSRLAERNYRHYPRHTIWGYEPLEDPPDKGQEVRVNQLPPIMEAVAIKTILKYNRGQSLRKSKP